MPCAQTRSPPGGRDLGFWRPRAYSHIGTNPRRSQDKAEANLGADTGHQESGATSAICRRTGGRDRRAAVDVRGGCVRLLPSRGFLRGVRHSCRPSLVADLRCRGTGNRSGINPSWDPRFAFVSTPVEALGWLARSSPWKPPPAPFWRTPSCRAQRASPGHRSQPRSSNAECARVKSHRPARCLSASRRRVQPATS
jgi:hypothetical protein